MRSGVHVSVRRGFAAAAHEAATLGCETLQIFTRAPSDGLNRLYTDDDYETFRRARESHALDPVVVHTPYLPNLATTNQPMYERTLRALKEDLHITERLGAEYLVIHPGSYSPDSTREAGLDRIGHAINDALAAVPGKAKILVENMAGGGRRIGGPASDIAGIFKRVREESRMGVCFDTCHAYGYGYDLRHAQGVHETLAEFEREIGLERFHVFHVNDSGGDKEGHRDLHEHLGRGQLGLGGLRRLFHRPEFRDAALILETPKLPYPESDFENLRRLRSCLPGAAQAEVA